MKRYEPNKVLGKEHSTRENSGSPTPLLWMPKIKLGQVIAITDYVTGSPALLITREEWELYQGGSWDMGSVLSAGHWHQGTF